VSLPVGTKVGRYTLGSVLGRGGLAEVYSARDDVSGGSVAVKVLHATGPEVVRRLLLEGRAQASLSHPNVVAVLDVIDAFGSPALVLERVEGPSLSERLAAGPVGEAEREVIAQGLLMGLAAAHGAGLIHRDVKPANLLLHSDDGVLVPKLSDFGLVAVVEPDPRATRLTRTGVGLGTPGYLAPEQLIDAKTVDQRADVFAAGITLFRLYIGQLPFAHRAPGDFLQAVKGAEPEVLAARFPGPRGALIARCLSHEPERRPEHAGALLRSWLIAGGEGEVEPPAQPAIPAERIDSVGSLSGSVDFETALSGLATGRVWTEQRAALSLRLGSDAAREAVDDAVVGLGGIALHHGGDRLCLMRSEEGAGALLRALVDARHASRGGLVSGAVQLRQNSAEQVARGSRRLEASGPVLDLAARLAALAPPGVVLRQVRDAPALGWWQLGAGGAPVALSAVAGEGLVEVPPRDSGDAWQVERAGSLWVPVRPPPHALPAEQDAWFGREGALSEVSGLLSGGASVTVLGVGGVGKTRFARRLAWSQLGRFRGGVWFCDLSEARDLDSVLGVVSRVLGVPLTQGDPLEQLGYALYARGGCLLVLDNLEQLVEPARQAVTRWRQLAPEATFLLTSRVRLELDDERVYPLEPLDIERAGVDLFADRAGLTLTAANRPQVEGIVRTLDGLPLALELAAARGLPLSELSAQLSARFGALSGVSGDRASTLVTAIDWSWDLLEGWERSALAQLSVFVGGFTLESAEAVLDLEAFEEAPWPEDAVQALIDKSLLRTWTVTGLADRADIEEPYFGMFVSIHQYAQHKLRTEGAFPHSGPRAEAHAWQRHGHHYTELGEEQALEALHGPQGLQLNKRMQQELDNLTAATRRAVERGEPDCAATAGAAAARVLWQVGPFTAGVALTRDLLALPSLSQRHRARLHMEAGNLCLPLGRWDEAVESFEAAHAAAIEAAAPRLAVEARHELAALASRQGRFAEAQDGLQEVLAQARALGHNPAERDALNVSGLVHLLQSDRENAVSTLEAGLALDEATGNALTRVRFLVNLGYVYSDRDEFMKAEPYFLEALAVSQEAGAPVKEIHAREHMTRVRRFQGRMDEALAHMEAGLALARRLGARRLEAVLLSNLSHLYGDMGDTREAIRAIDASLVIHRALGSMRFVHVFSGIRAIFMGDLGALEEAEAGLREAIDNLEEMGLRDPATEMRSNLALILKSTGRLEEARAMLKGCILGWVEFDDAKQRAIVTANLSALEQTFGDLAAGRAACEEATAALEGLGFRRIECFTSLCEGRLASREGRLEEAETPFLEALTRARETRSHNIEGGALRALLRLAVDRGRADEARAWAAAFSEPVLASQGPCVAAEMSSHLGLLAALEGDGEGARAHLVTAENALREMGVVAELSLVLADRAAAERLLGGDAGPALAEARALADRMGVPPGAWLRRRLDALG